MNNLAIELNKHFSGSVAEELLSDYGKRIYFPKGIVAQAAEAKQKATSHNATVGMAISKGKAVELDSLKKLIPSLTSSEAVTYAPTGGDPALIDLWKSELIKKNPNVVSDQVSNPVVTAGLTNGIFILLELFVNKNESVVIPDMFWGNYRLMIEERIQASIASFSFFNKEKKLNINGFVETIRKSAKNKKAVVIANFPNNPTGYSPSKKEVQELKESFVQLANEGYKLLVITDDAYFGLFFEEDTYKHSLFNELYNAHKNILVAKADGATKEHFAWGFRVGFVTFGSKEMTPEQYKALETKVAASIRCSISNCSRPGQSLLLHAMSSSTYQIEKASYEKEIKDRYLKIIPILSKYENDPVLEVLPFNSGYFMSFKMKHGSSEILRKLLLEKYKIGTISIKDEYLRVAFSSVDIENIEDLFMKIYQAASEI